MKKFSFLAAIVLLLMGACTRTDDTGQAPEPLAGKAGKERLYTIKRVGVATKAVAEKGKTWEPGSTITIKFLNGDAALQAKVQQYAAEWLQYANLKFKYVGAAEQADVKVGFEYGDEFPYISWSTIGTDCQLVPQDEASLNFVAFDGEEEVFIKAEVLRGFGHVLGLGFEHRSPNSPVEFKYTTTTEKNRLKGYFGLALDEIMESIVPLYTQSQSNYTEYDDASIMRLGLPGSILKNPALGVLTNSELSEMDKKFIGELYPKYKLTKTSLRTGTRFVLANDRIYGLTAWSNCGVFYFGSDALESIYINGQIPNYMSYHYESIVGCNGIVYFSTSTDSSKYDPLYHSLYHAFCINTEGKVFQCNIDSVAIFSTEMYNNDIYIGTTNGLFRASTSNPAILYKCPIELFSQGDFYPAKYLTNVVIRDLVKGKDGRLYFTQTEVYLINGVTYSKSAACYLQDDKIYSTIYGTSNDRAYSLIRSTDGSIFSRGVRNVYSVNGQNIQAIERATNSVNSIIASKVLAGFYIIDSDGLFYFNDNSLVKLKAKSSQSVCDFVGATSNGIFLLEREYLPEQDNYRFDLYYIDNSNNVNLVRKDFVVHDVIEAFGRTYLFANSGVWLFE